MRENLQKEEIDIQAESCIFGVCIVPTNMTFTTDLVPCIVICMSLLISPKLPNTEKADAQKCLQRANVKKFL